jgi:hypothetical protein
MRKAYIYIPIVLSFILLSCNQQESESTDAVSVGTELFTELPASYTGVDFSNTLKYDRDFNIYKYRNFYNGGGVALGDINQDGLPDMYFSANMSGNRLYLNKGDMRFEDITEKAGVAGTRAWSTGVTMADVNGDGLLDIYVCNSGDIKDDNKQNELFINNGDLTFTEKAEEYGLADRGYSTHAAFFDYDKDGDLDCYLLNNSYKAIGSFKLKRNARPDRDPIGGDKLFRNDGGNSFTDVTETSGVYGSIIGFGLGVTVGDVNRDGWQDIYVSNDFFERDYLYINNQDGTFTEDLESQMRSISAASMGADMADINNDGNPEIFVTDMLPESDSRLKQVTTFEDWDKYQTNLRFDYYHQFIRNMLHLNNGDGSFSEIGRLAGVEATDWSWGALIVDLDNDGLKDIFVANGIYQDLTDQDYINFISNVETMRAIITGDGVDYKALIDSIPIRPVANYAFQNQGDLKFSNQAAAWGLDKPSHSNGSAYGDLDNDGDLDLVVNNVNMPAFIYRNEADTLLAENRWLQFDLKGTAQNPNALGTKITINDKFFVEHMPIRGFQSSMDYQLHIGLGKMEKADKVQIAWPDGSVSILRDVETNQRLSLSQEESDKTDHANGEGDASKALFASKEVSSILDYEHKENPFIDFNRDRLLYHMLSTEGPKVCKGDVNGDGREDIFIGGAKDQAASLYLQQGNGRFTQANEDIFEKDKQAEDIDAIFFDADNDNDLDLYVCSGGYEYTAASTALLDRLYLNDGRGRFSRSDQILPGNRPESTSCVQANDIDGDGDQDLFVGVRLRPLLYGVPVSSYILENDGKGNFTNVAAQVAPELQDLGMITDVTWSDYDGDQDMDLLLMGDWTSMEVFENEGGKFSRKTSTAGLDKHRGWWNCIKGGDFDNDGDTDYILGNHGLNSRFEASAEKPIYMHINDFDQNGKAEQILSREEEGKLLPYARRHDLGMQLPGIKKRYLRFSNYVGQGMYDIFTDEALEQSVLQQVDQLSSAIAINNGDGTFELRDLPQQAQFSPIYGILVEDFDKDGKQDVLLGGNFHRAKPEVGRYDASYGLLLKGKGDGSFDALPASASGIRVDGEVRDIISLKSGGKDLIIFARNNAPLAVYEWK